MTQEQINASIALHLGWNFVPLFEGNYSLQDKGVAIKCWVKPGNDPWHTHDLPNYCGDLNSIHEAEKTLTDKEYDRFEEIVYDLVIDTLPLRDDIPGMEGLKVPIGFIRAVSATSIQRAEAFLRAINKWTADS